MVNTTIKDSEPYFSGPHGFKRYGIFAPVLIHLVTAINERSEDKLQVFEKDMDEFIALLDKNPRLLKEVLTILNKLRAKGFILMLHHKTERLQYHVAEHAAEVAYDTRRSLTNEYRKTFKTQTTANLFYTHLAESAAAWHDVVQSMFPPHNEEESGKAFLKQCQEYFFELQKRYPKLKKIVEKFLSHLEFISNELIVYNTWLVYGNEENLGIVAKTLRVHIENAMNDLNISPSYGKNMEHLLIAAKAISLSDVSRFSLEHVIHEQRLLKSYRSLKKDLKTPLEAFFKYCHINSSNEKEIFLGLFCSNIRMYTELNVPVDNLDPKSLQSNAAKISLEEYQLFISTLEKLRTAHRPQTIKLNYIRLLNLLMNTKSLKKNLTNSKREQLFALAQNTAMWRKFAVQLKKFDAFTKNSVKLG